MGKKKKKTSRRGRALVRKGCQTEEAATVVREKVALCSTGDDREQGALLARVWAQRHLILAYLSITVICLMSYSNGLTGEFVFDDTVAIVSNSDVQSAGNTDFGAIWKHDFWGKDIRSAGSHKSFRPLTTLSFRASFLMSGATLAKGARSKHSASSLNAKRLQRS